MTTDKKKGTKAQVAKESALSEQRAANANQAKANANQAKSNDATALANAEAAAQLDKIATSLQSTNQTAKTLSANLGALVDQRERDSAVLSGQGKILKSIRFLLWGVIIGVIASLAGVGLAVYNSSINVKNGEYLVECTTPGDRVPTKEDPSTGHKCYDDGGKRGQAFVVAIKDANGNGLIDTNEILEAIDGLEGTK